MSAAPEIWKAVWPRFGRVFPIELALSLLVMGVAWAAIAASATPAMFKARFAEAWLSMTPGRYEVMERIALGTEAGRSEIDEQRNLSRYVSSRRLVGATVVLTGEIPGIRGYEIGFYPALAKDETVAIWLCGRARAPEGWIAQAPAVTSNLPDRLLASECRARRDR